MSEPTVSKSDKTLKRATFALLLAAALVPFIASLSGPPLNQHTVRLIGAGYFGVVVMFAAAATFMKKRPESQQARVRFAIAACMLAQSAILVVADRHSDDAPVLAAVNKQTDSIFKGLETLIDAQVASRAALDRRFAALDLDNVLSAQRLTSAAGLAKSRATLEQQKALVRESDELDRSAVAAREAYLRAAALTEEQRRTFRAALAAPTPASSALDQELAAARQSSMAHINAVLDFAESRLGKTKLVDGDIMFAKDADVLEYSRLRTGVMLAAIKEEGIMKRLPN